MATAYIPIRSKGQTTCHHHRGRQLEFYCKQCLEVTCVKCLSSIHNCHPICELSEIIPQKKQDIRNFIDRTENNDLVQSGIYIASADTLLKDNDRMFEELSHQLKMQTEKLKQDLDKLTAETLSVYKNMKNDNNKLIQEYKQDIEMYDRQLKQQMTDCKTALQQGSHIEIYDTKCEIDSRIHLPVTPVMGTTSFTPNKNPQGHLELALGKVTTSAQGHTSTGQGRSVSSSAGQQQPSSQQQTDDKGKKAVTRTKLLIEAKVVEEWNSPSLIFSMYPTTDDQAWTKCGNTLTLLNRKGKVIQKVTHKAEINDISLSPTTHRLWACDDQNNILELVSGQLTKRFRTKEEPYSICVTENDSIIVGMSKHISKYTTQGQMVLTAKTRWRWKSLVCSPFRITECPITNNVAVIDNSNERDGGDGNKHVVVMDTDFQKLFVYRGDIPSTPQRRSSPFNPRGLVYDSHGNIIIGDQYNGNVLVISGDGEKVKVIHTDTDCVWAVGMGRDDLLWTYIGNKVKMLKYYRK
ncbi:tripartite motif-containing protein 3-like [Argopecten irradians]|uniref:tripartite motif-containing protein 3-like n=1 Tax=Argopecten irradians TaxID=31199 RepID=UPI0037178A39